jgi:SAM-dependent methyltransferase
VRTLAGDNPGEANQIRYTSGSFATQFRSTASWLDYGEQAAIEFVAGSVRGGSILDIGVGGGRTVSLMTLLSDDYRGIDYSPTMVDQCHQAFPDRNIEVGDARDLSRFKDSSFALVLFSFNGLDSVSHDDRQIVLREIHRVLEPDGYFVYSTFNRDGPHFDDRPWSGIRRARPNLATVKRAGRWFLTYGPDLRGRMKALMEWRRNRSIDDHGSWALGPLCGPGLGAVMHWSTTSGTSVELESVGLHLLNLHDPDGQRIDLAGINTSTMFHVVAQRSEISSEN